MQSPTALPHRQVLTSSAAKRRQKRHQALDREAIEFVVLLAPKLSVNCRTVKLRFTLRGLEAPLDGGTLSGGEVLQHFVQCGIHNFRRLSPAFGGWILRELFRIRAARPIARPAPTVRDRADPQLLIDHAVDDAIGKSPQSHASKLPSH
jgi:hypothetical protein